MIELERIKELAKKQHLSVREVNDRAGLGKNSIYNWKFTKPNSQALKAVAEVLGTTTDYLNGSNDSVHPYPDVSSIPIDDDKPYSYRGYHVPDKYLEIVKSLMDYDIGKGVADDVKD